MSSLCLSGRSQSGHLLSVTQARPETGTEGHNCHQHGNDTDNMGVIVQLCMVLSIKCGITVVGFLLAKTKYFLTIKTL